MNDDCGSGGYGNGYGNDDYNRPTIKISVGGDDYSGCRYILQLTHPNSFTNQRRSSNPTAHFSQEQLLRQLQHSVLLNRAQLAEMREHVLFRV